MILDFRRTGVLAAKLPRTATYFVIASLAIIGLPSSRAGNFSN